MEHLGGRTKRAWGQGSIGLQRPLGLLQPEWKDTAVDAGSGVYAEEVVTLLPALQGMPVDLVCVFFYIYQVIMQDTNEQRNEEALFMGVTNLSAQVGP